MGARWFFSFLCEKGMQRQSAVLLQETALPLGHARRGYARSHWHEGDCLQESEVSTAHSSLVTATARAARAE